MGLELLPEDPDGAKETAGRWVDLYAEAAAMDAAKVRTWACLTARAEALGAEPSSSPDEVAWVDALHRMADALARAARQ